MVKYTKNDFDRILFAISDSTRRSILDELFRGEKGVGELGEPFKISAPAISKHLSILSGTGLITTRKVGRRVICSLESDNLMRIATWLAKYHKLWEGRLREMEENIRLNAGKGYQG
ncbi:MAG: ArsR/SmtB family transcription factor [Minisyncoccota bacterium]